MNSDERRAFSAYWGNVMLDGLKARLAELEALAAANPEDDDIFLELVEFRRAVEWNEKRLGSLSSAALRAGNTLH